MEEGSQVIKKYYVYILTCSDQTLYIGSTDNLARRLHAHNNLKSGAHYTKIRRPVLLTYHEVYETFREARSREAKLKTFRKEEKLALIESARL